MFLGGVTLSAIAERGVIALGGGAAAPGPVALEAPLGQPCVGRSASANYSVDAGLWPDPGTPPVPGAYALSTYR